MKLLLCGLLLAPALMGACSIRGRVLDERGRGVRHAAVNALGQGQFGATTDTEGRYCIAQQPGNTPLPAGSYRLRAVARPLAVPAAADCTDCCAPATDLLTTYAASAVEVKPGAPAPEVNIRLRRGPVYCVRGEVREADGNRAARATLVLEREGDRTSLTAQHGRFLLTRLEPGRYRLIVLERWSPGHIAAFQPFEVRNHDIDPVVLVKARTQSAR
jgi:hypothetical protein